MTKLLSRWAGSHLGRHIKADQPATANLGVLS